MRRRFPLVLAGLVLATTAACGSDDGGSGESDAATEETPTTTTLRSDPIDGLDVAAAESTLILEGDGEEISGEGSVLIQSLFAVAKSGETLSSSYAQGGKAQPTDGAAGGCRAGLRWPAGPSSGWA